MGKGVAVEEFEKIFPNLLLMGQDVFTPLFCLALFLSLRFADCFNSFITLQCLSVSQRDALGNC